MLKMNLHTVFIIMKVIYLSHLIKMQCTLDLTTFRFFECFLFKPEKKKKYRKIRKLQKQILTKQNNRIDTDPFSSSRC